MEKIFKNKILAYVAAGALMILQLSMSIVRWCNGGFNGGSLILCLLMLGLLACTAIAIKKENNLLLAITATAVLSVFIYVKANDVSGFVIEASKGKMNTVAIIVFTFLTIGTLCLIISLVLALIKAFGYKKDLRLINTILCLVSALSFLIAIPCGIGENSTVVVNLLPESLFSIFLPLLVACVGYQLEFKE